MTEAKYKSITTRIRALKCWREVESKLQIGVNHLTIAGWIQSKGELTDVKDLTIAAGLAAIAGEVVALTGGTPDEVDFSSSAELNELEEMATLFQIQKTRVLNARKMEEKLNGGLNPRLSNDIRIAAELIRTVAQIKSDHRKNPVIAVPVGKKQGRERYGERVASVIENPKSRNRVMAAVDTLLTMGEEEIRSGDPDEEPEEEDE